MGSQVERGLEFSDSSTSANVSRNSRSFVSVFLCCMLESQRDETSKEPRTEIQGSFKLGRVQMQRLSQCRTAGRIAVSGSGVILRDGNPGMQISGNLDRKLLPFVPLCADVDGKFDYTKRASTSSCNGCARSDRIGLWCVQMVAAGDWMDKMWIARWSMLVGTVVVKQFAGDWKRSVSSREVSWTDYTRVGPSRRIVYAGDCECRVGEIAPGYL